MPGRVIMIDNFDSFTFNLVYELEAIGFEVDVFRNDTPLAVLLERAERHSASFVLSPGPGRPAQAGVCVELVRAAVGRFGVLGICLGHQAIVEAFGGRVGHAREIVHGRASDIRTKAHPLFGDAPRKLRVARYHSLAANRLPRCLESIAVTREGDVVMAVAHRRARIAGLQFHPESILTSGGRTLLADAMAWLSSADATEVPHATVA